MNNPVLTVSQLNYYLKSLIDGDPNLMGVFLTGEISNFTNHYKSGHFYFSLKDDKCVVKAVMFAGHARRVRFVPENGMKVLLRGRVSMYEAGGQVQLYVEDMQPDGLGALNLAFEQLKRKLEAQGLFDVSHKRPLPKYPERIGIITSPTGAAVHDMQKILRRRFPVAEIVFCPVLVQGEGAPAQLVDAIRRFNAIKAADVLIIGRGGGSLEDLWAFNDEAVARAVYGSSIPVISAVGHETDLTICDFVADLRAPTPSAAAELCTPDGEKLLYEIASLSYTMKATLTNRLGGLKQRLDSLSGAALSYHPQQQLFAKRQKTDELTLRMQASFSEKIHWEKERFLALAGKLHALSPLGVLSRGYAIAFDENKKVIKSVSAVEIGQPVTVKLSDGEFSASVVSKKGSVRLESEEDI